MLLSNGQGIDLTVYVLSLTNSSQSGAKGGAAYTTPRMSYCALRVKKTNESEWDEADVDPFHTIDANLIKR
jgi:hypothetical protein